MRLPVRTFSDVRHIGTLDAGDKGSRFRGSYEGAGLSVTDADHVADWCRIAKLGGLTPWRLAHPNRALRMLDAAQLDWRAIEPLLVEAGHLTSVEVWTTSWWDDEDDCEYTTAHDTLTAALEDLDDRGYDLPDDGTLDALPVTRTTRWVATERLHVAVGTNARTYATTDARALAAVLLSVEDGLDGVWWDSPATVWSAPRGVLHPHVVPGLVATLCA
jgi:hypothetical protein